MNKLLFNFERDFNDSITLVANNHKDLEDYLRERYDFYSIEVKDDYVCITERQGFSKEYVQLKWITQI